MLRQSWFYLAGFLLSWSPAFAQAPEARSRFQEPVSYRDIVKKVLPAVVSIEVTEFKPTARARARDLDPSDVPDGPTREFLEEQLRRQRNVPQSQFGSGVIIDKAGIIVTNHHVIDGAAQVKVILQDGKSYTSRSMASDPKTDVAIIKLNSHQVQQTLPSMAFGNSAEMEIGDRVLAIGAPFGLQGTVTQGIISAKGRTNINLNIYEDYLQTDAAINPGNSGGPLVNLDGKVIGINTAIQSRTGSFDGVGLAIPSEMAKEVVDQLIKNGKVRRGYLGVTLMPLENQTVADLLGVSDGKGVGVGGISANTPAAKAGLQEGDVILTIGGEKVNDLNGLKRIVAAAPLGKPVTVSCLRDGKLITLPVTIEEQPQNYGLVREVPRSRSVRSKNLENIDPLSVGRIGADVTDLNQDLVDTIGFSRNVSGAFVLNVERESIASDAQMARGMVVTQVNRKPVKTAEEFRKLVEKGDLAKGILLLVKKPDGTSAFLVLKEGE
jgi:serine protease Do